MKKVKKTIALALCVLMLSACMTGSFNFSSSAVSGLPTNLIVGYWHNFNNGSTTTHLANVNPEWDVLNVSFMETQGDRCTAKFVPDTEVYTSGDAAQQLKSDIAACQARGQKVVVSLGGQNGTISLNNNTQRDTFLSTSMAVIEEYGFDGFDVDLEGSSITLSGDTLATLSSPIQVNLSYILHHYVATYGSDFIITMAPEHPYVQGGSIAWGSPWGAYLPLLNHCRDILSWIHPQYYNNGISYANCNGYNSNSLIVCSEMLINGFSVATGEFFEGLDPSQVAFGVPAGPSAAGSGIQSVSEYQTALTTLLRKYPTFRGVMTWSTNWDEVQNNAFVNGMRSTISTYGSNAFSFGSVSANASEAEIGDTVTWNASTNNADGNVTYKFDLYKDGSKIVTGNYSSSSSYSYTFTQAGSYHVVVTARDSASSGDVSGTSATVTVTAPELYISSFNCNKSGLVEMGQAITYTANAVGGTAPLQYSFAVYKDGTLVSTSNYSANSTFVYTPTAGGEYQVRVTVKDSENLTVMASSSLVFVSEPLAVNDIAVSKSGSTTTFTANASGGTGGNLYSFYVYADGVIYARSVRASSATFSTDAVPSGSYNVRVYVEDNSGAMVAMSKGVN